jgi:GDPmannose 4,6-dehydratase
LRPAEVDLLIGDATKAKEQLGWQPKVTFNELVHLMVEADVSTVARNEHEGFGDTNLVDSPISVSS